MDQPSRGHRRAIQRSARQCLRRRHQLQRHPRDRADHHGGFRDRGICPREPARTTRRAQERHRRRHAGQSRRPTWRCDRLGHRLASHRRPHWALRCGFHRYRLDLRGSRGIHRDVWRQGGSQPGHVQGVGPGDIRSAGRGLRRHDGADRAGQQRSDHQAALVGEPRRRVVGARGRARRVHPDLGLRLLCCSPSCSRDFRWCRCHLSMR